MPSFCRHNRLVQNCPICSREQDVEARPILSSSAPRSTLARESSSPRTSSGRTSTGSPSKAPRTRGASGMRVRRLVRGGDDGFRCAAAPGLKSGADAERLADELAFAATRLKRLGENPPGLYAELAAGREELEELCWLAFLTAYLCPLESDQPFSAIEAIRTPWRSAELPALDAVELGPRSAHEPGRGTATLSAYRAWSVRAGSQADALRGEAGWSAERRFERVFERLALPGFHRDARFDLLVTLGRVGLFDLRAGKLHFGGENDVTVAAKRALGIGDPLLLERRAAQLAQECGLPIEALDLGFYNWGRGERATLGLSPGAEPAPELLSSARAGLGLPDPG
ncbi:MAG TPA: hypothetical protein VIM18_07305 [Solirubrobacteraceae bacterium]|jgi:hypothetical protein